MKALTISQPYADLIASGEKWIENRCWGTAYAGPLAIHAGKGSQYLSPSQLKRYPTGAFVAIARLGIAMHLDALRKEPQVLAELCGRSAREVLTNEHCEGPWCWILADVRALPEPIPWRGAQGLWDVPLDLEAKIERALNGQAKK